MKHLILVAVLLSLGLAGFAQNPGLKFDITGGAAIPLNGISTDTSFAGTGLQINSTLGYTGKYFGFEIEGGYFENPVRKKVNEYQAGLGLPSIVNFERDKWQTPYLSAGPLFNIENKIIGLQLSPKLGVRQTKAPAFEIFHEGSGISLFDFPETEPEPGLFASLGLKLKFNITKSIGLHVKADYLTDRWFSQTEYTILERELRDINGIPGIQQDELIEAPIVERPFRKKTEILKIGGGISIKFGKKQKERRSPNDPGSRTACDIEITNDTLWCDDPFFNSATQEIVYQGYVTLQNRSTNSLNLAEYQNPANISQFLRVSTGSIQIIGEKTAGGCLGALYIQNTLAPGQSKTYCVKVTVPFGTTATTIKAWGYHGPYQSSTQDWCEDVSNRLVNLPDCYCEPCESIQLVVDDQNGKISGGKLNHNGLEYGTGQIYTTFNAQTPITKITAEIVHFEHIANDSQCLVCNKESFSQGNFYFPNIGRNIINSPPANQFNNGNRQGAYRTSAINDYSKEVFWKSNIPTGVDLSSGMQIKFDLALPLYPDLECCSDTVRVCIRYTVQDAFCNTCEIVKCYELTRSFDPNGGISTGTGNQNPGGQLSN